MAQKHDSEQLESRIEALEMCMYRRLGLSSLKQKQSNTGILERLELKEN